MRLYKPRPLATAPRPREGTPTVSVVIPCYNYGHYLPAAVRSALDQSGVDVEVIVVDDASPDGSAAVARDLAAADPRVRVLAHETNAGHIRTYNDGLAHVRGEYVVLLSADDRLPTDAVTRAVALMEHHPSVGLVYGHPADFEDEPAPGRPRPTSWSVWAGHDWLRSLTRRGRNVILSPEVVLRREAWDEVGRYDPRLPHSADLALWLEVASRWDIGRVNGTVQAHYRVHGANMHLTTWAGTLTDLQERRRTFDLLFGENETLPADAARLHGRARRSLSRVARRRAGQPGVGTEEREALLGFAAETWTRGGQGPLPTTGWPLLRARNRARETLRYHRWKLVGL